MKVTGISWLGIGTERFDETLAFFSDILGLAPAAVDTRGVAMLWAGDTQIVEIFGPGTGGHAHTRPPVAAFEVEDFATARAELIARDVPLIGEPGAWNGFEWQYFRGPEDRVYAIKKTPPPGWEHT